MIIAFEGLDKSGKHTHSKNLKLFLESKGYSVDLISFPNYDSGTGSIIRSYLDKQLDLDKDTFYYLQFINKYEVMEKLRSRINSPNYILIIDRYIHSQMAYNGVRDIRLLSLLPSPNLVIFMDVDPETSIKRKGKFGYNDRFEEDIDFLRKVYQTYKGMINNNWLVIDGKRKKEEVEREITQKTMRFILERSEVIQWKGIYR